MFTFQTDGIFDMRILTELTNNIPRMINSPGISKSCVETLRIFHRWVKRKLPLQPCDAATIEVTVLEEQIARINRRFETGKVINKDVDLMNYFFKAVLRRIRTPPV